jgi:hypothetical protein
MRYFFDITDCESLTDDVGVEHNSPEDALQEAARAAVDIAKEILVPRDGGTLEIHVRNHKRRVGTVTINMHIKANSND